MMAIKRIYVLALFIIFPCQNFVEAATVINPFTAIAGSGPLAGAMETGYFWYDSEVVPIGGGAFNGNDISIGLDFTWDGVHYNADDITLVSIQWWNIGGELILGEVWFGTNCTIGIVTPGGCYFGGGEQNFSLFGSPAQEIAFFTYGLLNDTYYNGDVVFGSPYVVPLPSAFFLLLSSLFGIHRLTKK